MAKSHYRGRQPPKQNNRNLSLRRAGSTEGEKGKTRNGQIHTKIFNIIKHALLDLLQPEDLLKTV